MGKLEGVRVAVLVEDLYENLELWYPVLRLREEGAQVFVVGPKAGETYKSKEGYRQKLISLQRKSAPTKLMLSSFPADTLPIG